VHKEYKCFTTHAEILKLNKLDNTHFALYTRDDGILFASSLRCTIKSTLKNKTIDHSVTCIAFSPDAAFIVFYKNHYLYILHIETNLITQVIETHKEEIELLCFDPSSKYIIAGSKNGRVLQYRVDGSTLLARLCSFPYEQPLCGYKIRTNFVSECTFFNNMLAVTGYDGAIFIIHLLTQANKKVISHLKTRIDALCFIDEKTLISGNQDGVIRVYDLSKEITYKQINAPFINIKQIIAIPNSHNIIVHSQTKYITIIDIKNLKIIHDKYLIFEDSIQEITLIGESLLTVALKNKKILQVMLPNTQELHILVQNNLFVAAYKLLVDEPTLRGTQAEQELEERYKEIYSQAKSALIKKDEKRAHYLIDVFKKIPSKQNDIDTLFRAFKNYSQLQELFINKKYTLFYAMCTRYEPLQSTPEYTKMENIFKDSFTKAQRQILLNNKENAQFILKDFITVTSKRAIIHLILHSNTLFIDFLRAVDEKDFQKIYTLASKNNLLAQLPNYQALQEELEIMLDKITKQIDNGNISSAKITLHKLQNIQHINKKISALRTRSKNMLQLQNAYNKDDFTSCYEILDTHPSLCTTELGILLEKHFSKLIDRCEVFALNGEIVSIKDTLGTLIEIRTRKEKIGNTLRVSFWSKLHTLLSEKNFKDAEKIIYTYIDIFGIESEIYALMMKYEKKSSKKLTITHNQNARVPRDHWQK